MSSQNDSTLVWNGRPPSAFESALAFAGRAGPYEARACASVIALCRIMSR